jgi:hypothetical protein
MHVSWCHALWCHPKRARQWPRERSCSKVPCNAPWRLELGRVDVHPRRRIWCEGQHVQVVRCRRQRVHGTSTRSPHHSWKQRRQRRVPRRQRDRGAKDGRTRRFVPRIKRVAVTRARCTVRRVRSREQRVSVRDQQQQMHTLHEGSQHNPIMTTEETCHSITRKSMCSCDFVHRPTAQHAVTTRACAHCWPTLERTQRSTFDKKMQRPPTRVFTGHPPPSCKRNMQ